MFQKILSLCAICLALAMFTGCTELTGVKDAIGQAAQADAAAGSEEPQPSQAPTELNLSSSGLTDGDLPALAENTQLVSLDLRDNELSIDAVTALISALPQCQILWSIPVGSMRFDSDSTQISLPQDVEADALECLKLFPNLTAVDATALQDTKGLPAIAAELPSVSFSWNVTLCGQSYPSTSKELDLTGAELGDPVALASGLSAFSQLEKVDLSGQSLEFSTMDALMEACPNTAFTWSFSLCGVEVSSDMTEVDISGKQVDSVEDVKSKLRYLPNLTKLDMCNCGPTNEEMETLITAYPAVKFVWIIQVGGWEMRTDVKAFSKGNRHHFEGGRYTGGKSNFGNDDIQPLKYCTDLVALDLGHGNRITDLSILQYLPKLRFLIVAMNNIESIEDLKYCPDLEYLETFQNYISDWTPLLSLKKLTHLNCSTNFGKSESGDKIYPDYKILMQMPQLQRLWIIRCGLSDQQLQELQAALPACKICTTGVHSTSNNWRDNDLYKEMQDLFSLPYSD